MAPKFSRIVNEQLCNELVAFLPSMFNMNAGKIYLFEKEKVGNAIFRVKMSHDVPLQMVNLCVDSYLRGRSIRELVTTMVI